VFLVVSDVPADSGAHVVTSSISRICRLSLSEVLIGVGLRACIHRDECACVFVSACVYCVSQKKLYGVWCRECHLQFVDSKGEG
jgi:hypothetical protein